jgi:transcriptional regulator with XRE-family HTH domain
MVKEDASLETFGQRVRTLRRKKGLSQKALAEYLGMREATLSRYENDKRAYQWGALIKLADALDTSTDFLLCRTNVSAPIHRLVSENGDPGGELPFFEAYSKLRPDDQNLMMERLLTIYDIRNKDAARDE